MMITSNIKFVKRRLQQVQRAIPGAVNKSISPEFWIERLKFTALKTIRKQWAGERRLALRELYEKITPFIVETVTGNPIEHGAVYLMTIPRTAGLKPDVDLREAIKFNLAYITSITTPTGRLRKGLTPESIAMMAVDESENLQRAREAVADWVQFEKRRDEGDAGLTDDEIIERIEVILGLSSNWKIERTPEMDAAADKLVPAIERWLGGEGDSPPTKRVSSSISNETIRQWLHAVLVAWRMDILGLLPIRLSLEIRYATL